MDCDKVGTLLLMFMVTSAMAKPTDSDCYVECDETTLASLISPSGPEATIGSLLENLSSYADEKTKELSEGLLVCEDRLNKSELSRSLVIDLAFDFTNGPWKLEEKAQLAWNLSVIKLALAKRALKEGSAELAWEALASASYYSGYFEAATYTSGSPTAQRSAKGGKKRAEKVDEAVVLLSCLVKNQLINNAPRRGWSNQPVTVEKVTGNLLPLIEEFKFPLPDQFAALCDMVNKLFEDNKSIKEAYLVNRGSSH
ncbi:hypothetical protein [Chromohalobacter japonicus]|uniref:hypothetical protein n=1 Tax=Chromohalobacter japonicus TaxID=223900 RepID=UPI00111508BB|nr:hypothetical protein [Chromohalobacter japonicus]